MKACGAFTRIDRVLLPGSVVLPGDDAVKARPPPPGVPSRFDPLDAAIAESLARYGITVIGLGLGFISFWFGALKFVPGMSPAEDLAARTIEHLTVGTIGPAVSLPVLATWEYAIGLGLLTKRFLRATLLLLAVQQVGTAMPLILVSGGDVYALPICSNARGPAHRQECRVNRRGHGHRGYGRLTFDNRATRPQPHLPYRLRARIGDQNGSSQ